MNDPLMLLMTTCDRREILQEMAFRLVEETLAACVQIGGPVQSVYRWNGTTEAADEWLLTAKVLQSQVEATMDFIRQKHPYETPELVAVPVASVSDDYYQWAASQIRNRT